MKRSFRPSFHAGFAAIVGVAIAATAAFAYDRADPAPHSALFVAEADPGVDFMITGPAGPGEKPVVRSEAIVPEKAERAPRRRMHLK